MECFTAVPLVATHSLEHSMHIFLRSSRSFKVRPLNMYSKENKYILLVTLAQFEFSFLFMINLPKQGYDVMSICERSSIPFNSKSDITLFFK